MDAGLEERKERVLAAVIRQYIFTAEPVGSRTVAERYDLGVSAATLRNDMATLEAEGYLVQPHVSAGRIPTEKGYRYYVDALMDRETLTAADEGAIRRLLRALNREAEDTLREVSGLLSELTQYTAVVLAPPLTPTIKRFDLVPLGERLILAVLVTVGGDVAKQRFELDEAIDEASVSELEVLLNDALCGDTPANLTQVSRALLNSEPGRPALARQQGQLLEKVAAWLPSLTGEAPGRIYVEGTARFLEQPEFSAAKTFRRIFSVLEESYSLIYALQGHFTTPQVVVKIGSELTWLPSECSFVGTSYRYQGARAGTLGILGPTRMNYPRAVSAVEGVASRLSHLFSEP